LVTARTEADLDKITRRFVNLPPLDIDIDSLPSIPSHTPPPPTTYLPPILLFIAATTISHPPGTSVAHAAVAAAPTPAPAPAQQPPAGAAQPAPAPAKEIRMNTLTPFKGDRKKLDEFLIDLNMYLRMNRQIYNNNNK